MGGFTEHIGKIAVYNADHVDTDRIIPARFLSMVTRQGYGQLLFKDVRGSDFPLDQPTAHGASILVVGTNFGCGSSREHAVWAIQQAGFRAVIARREPTSPGYSDIFRQNAANCGLLLVELEPGTHSKLVALGNGAEVKIDILNQELLVDGQRFSFELAPAIKRQIIEGLDLIGTTLVHEADIAGFEQKNQTFVPPRVFSQAGTSK